MHAKQHVELKIATERQRLVSAYRLVVRSVREAHSLQTVLEKERQMRRLMRQLRLADGAR